ncbi:MAG TPA: hypothetical protein PKJ77_06450, partial [Thermodesulfobacteriota bacterium]|nr:hypothetical protein [Thermodesulfobacteriota bacterium]
QRSLNLVQPPIFSVSSQFAADLVEDVVQTSVLGPHLQNQLRGHLLGVDNGPFITCAVDGEVLADLRQGRCAGLEKWKHQKRQEALKAFGDLYASRDNPCWGNLREFGQHEAPWFVMAGRDDPRQKGYDVAAAAAGEFLESGGDAQFIFFPIPGDEGLAGLRFLKRLAGRFPDRVLAVPARLREGFAAALQGSSFGLMPSLYEPFGMVHEFNFNGTVGIGRATGGIIEQIVPWRAASACSTAVQSRADRWHSFSAEPTGILFRESDAIGSRTDDWALLNGTKYPTDDEDTDRLVQREHIALFGAMVRELHAAIRDGQQMVAKRPALYCRMVAEGIGYIERTFAWERAAREYVRHVVEC